MPSSTRILYQTSLEPILCCDRVARPLLKPAKLRATQDIRDLALLGGLPPSAIEYRQDLEVLRIIYPKLIGILEYEYPNGLDENRPRLRKKKGGMRLFSVLLFGGGDFVEVSEESVKAICGEKRWMRGQLGQNLVRKAHIQYRCLQDAHTKQGFKMLAIEWRVRKVKGEIPRVTCSETGDGSPVVTQLALGEITDNVVELPLERLENEACPLINILPTPISASKLDSPQLKAMNRLKTQALKRLEPSLSMRSSKSAELFLGIKYGKVYNYLTHKPCSKDNRRLESISCFDWVRISNPHRQYGSCGKHTLSSPVYATAPSC